MKLRGRVSLIEINFDYMDRLCSLWISELTPKAKSRPWHLDDLSLLPCHIADACHVAIPAWLIRYDRHIGNDLAGVCWRQLARRPHPGDADDLAPGYDSVFIRLRIVEGLPPAAETVPRAEPVHRLFCYLDLFCDSFVSSFGRTFVKVKGCQCRMNRRETWNAFEINRFPRAARDE